MFVVEMLPAGKGDALWIEYGDADAPTRMLIDGGYVGTVKAQRKRMKKLADAEDDKKLAFELLVVSHVDADHILGAIEILGNPSEYPVTFDDIWFNGWWMLPDQGASVEEWAARTGIRDDYLGGQHGEYLDAIFQGFINNGTPLPLNAAEDGRPIFVGTQSAPRTLELPSGMKLTLLSPTFAKLQALTDTWLEDAQNAGLDRASTVIDKIRSRSMVDDDVSDMLGSDSSDVSDFLGHEPTGEIPPDLAGLLVDRTDDTSNRNGSSIAFIADYGGQRVLFAADAHNDVLEQSLKKLAADAGRVKVDAVKMPHHGSKNNTTDDWLQYVDSRVFMFSTSGAGSHYHPDREAVARVIAGKWRPENGPRLELIFNYRSNTTDVWDRSVLKETHNYQAHYPTEDITKESPGIRLDLDDIPQ